MRALYADGVQVIGIWGLGGVGKTTLVKNLNNELEKDSTQPFGIVIWATISKNFVIKNVQTRIVERLKLEVKMEESEQGTASRLYQRFENEKKFLDDVWEKIDLGSLGVPGPEVHKGLKNMAPDPVVPNLRILELKDLPSLRTLCRGHV
nr:disease resistance protein [Quercus suber]